MDFVPNFNRMSPCVPKLNHVLFVLKRNVNLTLCNLWMNFTKCQQSFALLCKTGNNNPHNNHQLSCWQWQWSLSKDFNDANDKDREEKKGMSVIKWVKGEELRQERK